MAEDAEKLQAALDGSGLESWCRAAPEKAPASSRASQLLSLSHTASMNEDALQQAQGRLEPRS